MLVKTPLAYIKILTLLCFLIINYTASAKPFFAITTTQSIINVEAESVGETTFTVYNNSGIFAKKIIYDIGYPNLTNVAIDPNGTTCGKNLAANTSCILKILIFAGSKPKSFRLMPRVCTDNGVVCSVPDANNRPIVNVLPISLILEVDTTASDLHLQLRALRLINAGTKTVELDNIDVIASANIANQVNACNASTSCTPPTASAPSCFTNTTLNGGSSCLIWLRSLDLPTQGLGALSGTVTVNLTTTPVSKVDRTTFTIDYFNDLYAGGNFSTASGVPNTNRIAKFNGTAWSSLSTGINNNNVNALYMFDFDLYIGGNFTNVSSPDGDRILRWDGVQYNALSTGIGNFAVQTLTEYNNNLIIGGNFTNVGGPDGDRIVSWDGTAFSPLANGINNNVVFSLIVYQNDLIVGGSFINVVIPNGNRIVSFDGTQFNALSSGLSGGVVRAFVIQNSILYVGGTFTNQYGATGDRILSFDGINFSPLSLVTAPNNNVLALTIFNNNVVLAGQFTNIANRIASWNGATYSGFGAGIPMGIVNALAVVQDQFLYAAGTFTNPQSRIAVWDGANWNAVVAGTDNDINTLLVGSSLVLQ